MTSWATILLDNSILTIVVDKDNEVDKSDDSGIIKKLTYSQKHQ